jgi:hypothetical protein
MPIWQGESKSYSNTQPVVNFHDAFVQPDDFPAKGKAQAGPAWFGGEKGVENIRHIPWGYPPAGVGNYKRDAWLRAGTFAGGDPEPARELVPFAGHGFHGVDGKVDESLFYLRGIHVHGRQVGGQIQLDLYPLFGHDPPIKVGDLPDDLIEVRLFAVVELAARNVQRVL